MVDAILDGIRREMRKQGGTDRSTSTLRSAVGVELCLPKQMPLLYRPQRSITPQRPIRRPLLRVESFRWLPPRICRLFDQVILLGDPAGGMHQLQLPLTTSRPYIKPTMEKDPGETPTSTDYHDRPPCSHDSPMGVDKMDISEDSRASPMRMSAGLPGSTPGNQAVTAYGHRILERGLEPQTNRCTVALPDDTVDLDSGGTTINILPLDDWVTSSFESL